MSQTLSGSSSNVPKSTCKQCSRTVCIVSVGGRRTAVDPELIAVVPASTQGRTRSSSSESMPARRIHAEMCDSYRLQAESSAQRRKIAAEKQEFARRTRRKPGL